MAYIESNGKKEEVVDGDPIVKAAEKLGVPFGCYEGICGACKIKILEGMENLEGLTDREKDMGLSEDERLACQCKIKSGIVKISF